MTDSNKKPTNKPSSALPKKPKRKLIDWDTIEPLYKLGSLSNYQVCSQYAEDHKHSQTWKHNVSEAAIRKQAKLKGWQKNLADKVQKKVRENLVREQVRTANQTETGLTDNEIIEKAAEVGSGVVLRHRAEIKALLELEEAFLIELGGKPQKGQFASFKGKISSVDVDLTVSEKAKTLKDLAGVRAQRIALERQAFNIKDDTEPDDGKQEDNKWIFEAVKVVRHSNDADT
ncbi:MAG: hypothetical protein GY710_13990 [Desulfobacteraceae bacterium]|nr:hypothetical protein [Desulfobacteraceae bacterium]